MLVKYATKEDIQRALDKVNEKFDGNIKFKSMKPDGKFWHTVTLTVIDSKLSGSGINPINGHRKACACWHVHGTFIDALPENTEIHTALHGKVVTYPGMPWNDFKMGSNAFPFMASEACNCGGND